jgi:hypothetical protein
MSDFMSSMNVVVGMVAVLACSACGGSEDDRNDGGGTGGGTVTDAWRAYCTGVFTKDYDVIDSFDEMQFQARAGQEYLLSEYGDGFGPKAQMIYLWPGGPEEFEVTGATTADFPFTTSCPLNTATPYYAVFEDASVFADEALTTKLCELKSGTALPRTNSQSGYSLVTLNFTGNNIFEVYLNAFSAQCGGAASGYVSVPPVKSFDSTTWLVPILSVLAPP